MKTRGKKAAKRAQVAVDAYMCGDIDATETIASDLICDVLHWARAQGDSVSRVLERAQCHYSAEKQLDRRNARKDEI